jgi:hypothetical protein
MAGLLAKLAYAGKRANDPKFDRFDDVDNIQVFSLATAARTIGGESGEQLLGQFA